MPRSTARKRKQIIIPNIKSYFSRFYSEIEDYKNITYYSHNKTQKFCVKAGTVLSLLKFQLKWDPRLKCLKEKRNRFEMPGLRIIAGENPTFEP